MTLVIGSLSHDYIVLAADRRLTLPDGSLHDDDSNKAVFYCGRIALAYCGLARLGSVETSEWLGELLVGFTSIEPAMEHIAERLTRYFHQSRERDKRIAVMATGWATYGGQGPARPFCSIASNFLTDDGRWVESARSRMLVTTHLLDPRQDAALVGMGQALHRDDWLWLERQARRAVAHRTGPLPRVRLLGEMIRGVSTVNARVGPALIIQSLSWAAVSAGKRDLLTPISSNANSFLYVAADGSTERFKGPIYVCDGMMMKGLEGGTIPSDSREARLDDPPTEDAR